LAYFALLADRLDERLDQADRFVHRRLHGLTQPDPPIIRFECRRLAPDHQQALRLAAESFD
jgi:hypothetical protein